jgi:hypothetical protein
VYTICAPYSTFYTFFPHPTLSHWYQPPDKTSYALLFSFLFFIKNNDILRFEENIICNAIIPNLLTQVLTKEAIPFSYYLFSLYLKNNLSLQFSVTRYVIFPETL